MENSIISEGKTTNEAIEKGLKILKVSKDMVDIKVIENEEKRSFFSILAPRVVKVELTLKEKNVKEQSKTKKQEDDINKKTTQTEKVKLDPENEELKLVIKKLDDFLLGFIYQIKTKATHKISIKDNYLYITINGEALNFLIGYRGETLNSLQTILSSIASKYSKERIRILLDIENYREKRDKALEELAEKIAKTVIKTNKSITLEPMTAYERKVIHSKLQNHPKVKTFSVENEPYRRVVIAIK